MNSVVKSLFQDGRSPSVAVKPFGFIGPMTLAKFCALMLLQANPNPHNLELFE
jgi:hypothetical protein